MEKLIYIHQKNKYFYIFKLCVLSFFFALTNFIALLNLWQIEFSSRNLFRQNILEELKYIYNHITVFLMRDGWIFREVESSAESANTFLLIFLCVLISLSFFSLRNKLKWLVFTITLPFFISVLATRYMCSQNILVVWVIASLLTYKEVNDDSYDLSKGRDLIVALIFGILILTLINVDKVSDFTTRASFAEKIGNSLETKVSKFLNGRLKFNEGEALLSDRPISSSSITSEDKKKNESKEEVALTIKTKEAKPMYLRGYVGEFFDGKKWQQLDPVIYRNSRSLMYWLNKSDFNGIGQIGQISNLISNEKEKKSLEINIGKARKNIIYTPYEVQKAENGNFIDWNSSYFREKGLLNSSNYKFDINDDTAYDKWTHLSSKLALKQDDKELENYINAQSHYNAWVYDNYLALNRQDALILKEIFGELEDDEEHLDYKKAIGNIRGFLDETFLYTEEKTIPKNNKFSFLYEALSSKKAYDSQLATIATLAFRHYKIPARYVEGYLVTQKDIDDSKGKDIKIKSSNIHSWVEIYIDGVGFVPIEVSSAYRGIMPEADLSVGLENFQSNSKLIKKQDKLKGKSFEKKSDKETKKDSGLDKVIKNVKFAFFVFLALLILWLVLRPIFRIIRKKGKEKVFNSKDYKLASQHIFKAMKDEKLKLTDSLIDIGNRASYSKEKISCKERDEMLLELKVHRRNIKKKLIKNKLGFLGRLYGKKAKK